MAPKTLTILNDQLLDSTAQATIGIQLKDQYGQDVKFTNSDFAVTAFNTTQGKPVTVSYDSTKGFYINTAAHDEQSNDEFKVGDEIKVSFYHKSSGLSASKTLKVVAGAQLGSVDFGSVILPSGKDKLTEDLTNVKVPYVAKDQYGNTIDLSPSNVEVISSDESIVSKNDVSFTTTGDDKKPVINIAKFKKSGTVTLAFLNKATGDVYKLNLTINEKPGVISKVAVDNSNVKIAKGHGSYAYVDLNVTDNYGTKIEPKDYASAPAFTIVSSNRKVVSDPSIEADPTSDNYGKLKVTLADTAEKGDTANVTVTVNKTGQSATFRVEVGEAAVPSQIKVASTDKHDGSLLVGSTTTVNFDLFDQYLNNAVDTDGYQVKYEVTGTNQDAITLSKTAENAGDLTGASVDVTGAKEGSATLVASLVKGSDVVSKVEVPFTVAANSSAKYTYAVSDIPTLYKDGDGSDAVLDQSEIGSNKEAKPIKVVAKAADGSSLTVPNSAIISVTPLTSNVKVAKDNATGQWYVAGSAPSITEDATGKIRVNVATDEGTVTLDKEVKISKDDLEIQSLKLQDSPAGTTNAKTLKGITQSHYTDTITFNDTNKPYLVSVDQFGVESNFDVADADTVRTSAFKGITAYADDTFTSKTNAITVADVGGDTVADANSSYRLTIIEHGAALDIPVTVTNALADKTAPTATGDFSDTNTKVVTINFSEAMDPDTLVKENFSSTAGGDITAFSKAADNKSVTITFKNGLNTDDTVTINAAVKDANGNAISTTSITKK